MCLSSVNFQTISSLELNFTVVTLKCFIFLNRRLIGFHARFPLQEFLFAFCIPPESRWAFPWSLLGPCRQGVPALLCVQGEGEGGAHVEGEVKREALAGQCLAKVHALGGQGTVSFARGSHFILLLNYGITEA